MVVGGDYCRIVGYYVVLRLLEWTKGLQCVFMSYKIINARGTLVIIRARIYMYQKKPKYVI